MISSRSASGSPSWPVGVVVHDHAAGHDPVVGSGVGGEPLTALRWRSAGRAGPAGPRGRRARTGAARIAKNTLGWTTPPYAPRNKPTAGPRSPSPATPSYVSPEASSTNSASPGNAPTTPANYPRPGPARVSATSHHTRHTRQPTEIRRHWPPVPTRHPHRRATRLVEGDRQALARSITLVESTRPDHRTAGAALLDAVLAHTGGATR